LVAELEELVAAHPLSERLGGQLLRALALQGRQADALGAYERLRARLADELGIDPSPELQAVHVAVLRGELAPKDPATAPTGHLQAAPGAPPPPAVARTNLRAPITRFVGRGDDLTRIMAAFAGARLVTLTGPGGAGKTRLAGQVARQVAGRFADGAWLAELAPVRDPAQVAAVVAAALGIREQPGESPRVLWRLPIHGRVGRWEQHGSIRTSCVTGRSGWCWTWSRIRTPA
jgi:hypothetical protein